VLKVAQMVFIYQMENVNQGLVDQVFILLEIYVKSVQDFLRLSNAITLVVLELNLLVKIVYRFVN
jgi:hypothetical protein